MINSMYKKILKISFAICFVYFLSYNSAWSQNGKVPPLVSVQEANSRLVTESRLLDEQIKTIESGGGTVDPELRFKFQLYSSVNELLEKKDVGVTTFSAIAGNSNYKGLKMDDQAYQDLIDGTWDVNMTDLILLLTK